LSGDARQAFLTGLAALRQSLDSPLVSAGDAVGAFLRRGLTIVSYNLLETFVADRLEEVVNYVNGGITHFADLPDRLQRAASVDVLRVANFRVQRGGLDSAAIIAFTTAIGQSLAASSGPVRLSSLTWQWAGSNMGPEDLRRALRLFHVESPWRTIETLATRIGSGMSDPETILAGLLRERNNSAHQSSYQVSNLLIRAVPHQLQVIGMCFDMAISMSAQEMHLGRRDFLENDNWMSPARVKFRFVQERRREWAEIAEGSSRAAKVSADKNDVIKSAINSAIGKNQVVVIKDLTLQPLDWIYPELP
jgi:hypothetical protein